ncbi:MAG: SDR family NAD(P)-dependent oxidoreductase, partial [Pyrinomonadaceae bacterium]|nr:SDR family NAD(P)-dependent oxidoreductase [Pyrinomonadaceae bacterium]
MNDKVAIITGASSGIGRAAALLFAEKGTKVIAVGRNESELGLLRSEAREKNGS